MENASQETQEQEEFIDIETPVPLLESEPVLSTNLEDIETNDIVDDPTFKPPEVDYDSIGEFCFESDELALKGNVDYKNLLEAIVVLEAQRAKAVKDIETLLKQKEEALANPFEFVERLRRKEDMKFPAPQNIHPIPVIDWSKYALSGNPSAFSRRQMYEQRLITQDFSKNSNKGKPGNANTDPKPAGMYRPWSAKEEKQLRNLIMEFPYDHDEDEASRWKKIASCLENRTPIEVATRVHMYYISVMDNGTTLPGRPDLNALRKQWLSEEMMNSNSEVENHPQDTQENNMAYKMENSEEEEEIDTDLQDTPEFQELLLLRKALREKIAEESRSLAQHIGYKCCRCKTEPIVGIRWHCVECMPPMCIDFCDECAGSMHEIGQHTSEHQLEKVHGSKACFDRDYMHFPGNDYNYLDPNYMPVA